MQFKCSRDALNLKLNKAGLYPGLKLHWIMPFEALFGMLAIYWNNCSSLDNCTSSNPIYTATATGNYSVQLTVTDANNCTGSGSVTLHVLDSLNVNVSADTTICDGNVVHLQSNGGASYLWSLLLIPILLLLVFTR